MCFCTMYPWLVYKRVLVLGFDKTMSHGAESALESQLWFWKRLHRGFVTCCFGTVLKRMGSISASSWVNVRLLESVWFESTAVRNNTSTHFPVCFCITWFVSVKLCHWSRRDRQKQKRQTKATESASEKGCLATITGQVKFIYSEPYPEAQLLNFIEPTRLQPYQDNTETFPPEQFLWRKWSYLRTQGAWNSVHTVEMK